MLMVSGFPFEHENSSTQKSTGMFYLNLSFKAFVAILKLITENFATNRLGINSIRPSPSPREIGNHLEQWDKEFVQKNPYESTGTPNVFALMMQQLITHDNSGFVKTQMTGN